MMTVLLTIGTRPEAIKLAPVIQELRRRSERIRSVVCVTGQHREMLDQVLDLFGIRPDFDLDLMQPDQSLTQLTAKVLISMEPLLAEIRPDWVVAQGDTTTMMAVSLAAFYQGVRVAHVEAGLRTHDKHAPFPEEINRRIAAVVADLHFAPTESARQALLREGIPDGTIRVTGNTVIDALLWVRKQVERVPPWLPAGIEKALNLGRMVLVTAHRRESFDGGLEQICLGLRELVARYPDVWIVYPVHLNPRVREPVFKVLGDVPRICLVDPLPYASFVRLMDRAYMVLTDSGGIQEEAPSLGKPVLVMRDKTERPEGVEAGNARVVGRECAGIVREASDLLENRDRYEMMARSANPYGDGKAALRIADSLVGTAAR